MELERLVEVEELLGFWVLIARWVDVWVSADVVPLLIGGRVGLFPGCCGGRAARGMAVEVLEDITLCNARQHSSLAIEEKILMELWNFEDQN